MINTGFLTVTIMWFVRLNQIRESSVHPSICLSFSQFLPLSHLPFPKGNFGDRYFGTDAPSDWCESDEGMDYWRVMLQGGRAPWNRGKEPLPLTTWRRWHRCWLFTVIQIILPNMLMTCQKQLCCFDMRSCRILHSWNNPHLSASELCWSIDRSLSYSDQFDSSLHKSMKVSFHQHYHSENNYNGDKNWRVFVLVNIKPNWKRTNIWRSKDFELCSSRLTEKHRYDNKGWRWENSRTSHPLPLLLLQNEDWT